MRNQDRAVIPLNTRSNVLIFVSLVLLSIWISYSGTTFWNYAALKRFWLFVGDLSVFFALISLSFWALRKVIVVIKKKGTTRLSWVNGRTLLFLRNAHITGGWLAFALGVGHAIFFILKLPWGISPVNTGVATLIAMFLLFAFGVLYQYQKIKLMARSWHINLAIIFSIVLITHAM